jgi:hypothetical protein
MTVSSFNGLFGDADGLLGSVYLDGIAPTLSMTSLHRLVVTKGLIKTSRAKSTHGHWRTKTQCKSDPDLNYWKSPVALSASLNKTVQALNPTTLATTTSRLEALRTDTVGCILLVTQCINSANSTKPDPPVITLVAAPSVATFKSPPTPEEAPGVIYDDL